MTGPVDSTISGLPAASTLDGTEVVPCDQTSGGNTVTKKATLNLVFSEMVGDTTDTAKGSSLVAHYEGAGTARTLRNILRDTVLVRDYVTAGAGTTVSPWTGWDTQIGTWEAKRYHFTAGVYGFTTAPNWGVENIHIDCDPGVTFLFSGAGTKAITFDAGVAPTNVYGVLMTGFPMIIGAATTSYALYVRGIHHSVIEARPQDCTTAATQIEFSVCSTFRLITSPVYGAFSTTPGKGLVLDERSSGESVSWCLFERPIMEGVNGAGIDIIKGNGNLFLSGTSESNQKGVAIQANQRTNAFINMDFEDNSVSDIEDAGCGTVIKSCNAISAGSTGTTDLAGDGAQVIAGRHIAINIQSTAASTALRGVGVGAGGITAAAAYIQDGCYNVDASGFYSSDIVDPAFLAFNSVTDADVTGNNTVYTVICDSEVYDKNANYNNATGVFTAPRPGLYRFVGQVLVDQLGTGDRFVEIRLVTSNRTYYAQLSLRVDATYTASINVLADMDAADTARIDVRANGVGADTSDVFGDATGLYTFFSGKLEEPR